MSMFFRKKNELSPLVPSDNTINERILRTIEQADLDPQEVMVVGSAALLLYGAELDFYDPDLGEIRERPGDVDFASTASYMEDLFANGTRSGAVAIRKPSDNKRQVMLRIKTDFLPVDVITRYRDGGNMERYDERFRRAVLARSSRPIDGASARVATPSYLRGELKFNAPLYAKASQDSMAFEKSQRQ
jgi:hypothetical protein